ncbi:hypothetical protein [Marinococcus luteus]|uniref:hypothetical protein n=1 Tax=Marinococcus luteus TaxID=1122204 RepID=UPI002ACC62F4|nr:hypothetical protein [Marinococcus luteus]MDZ5784098.1 hypothetical protein [Marinococcus luteus]
MENYLDVMKQNLGITETMLEGLIYVQKQLSKRSYPEAVQLMEDIILSFTAVERSSRSVLRNIENTEVAEKYFTNVCANLDLVVTHLESRSYAKLQEVFQFTLIPNIKKLQRELERHFQPYVLS